MHHQGIACTRSFYMGSTTAVYLSVLNEMEKNYFQFYENLVNPLRSEVMLVFKLTQALSVTVLQSLVTNKGR